MVLPRSYTRTYFLKLTSGFNSRVNSLQNNSLGNKQQGSGLARGTGELQEEVEKTPERELLMDATVSGRDHLLLPPALTLQRKRSILITTPKARELTLCQAPG